MSQQETAQPANGIPPEMAVVQMISGYWVSQVIYAAAKLGIADLVKDTPKNCDELAAATGTNPRSIYRLLRSLASMGVFAETDPGYFTLTPLAAYLQSDIPGSLRAFAIMAGEEHYQAWGNILHSIQTGGCAFEDLYGMNVFEYYAQNPEPAQIFDRAMTNFSSIEKNAVVSSYDFSSIQTIVDVAGGHGSLLAAILKANPHLQGILFDRPAVIEGAKTAIESEGIAQRCQLVGGSFFESVPEGADAYILKHIIHDWDDERSIAILKNCHQAMSENGKLLIVEQVIPPGNKPFIGKLLDINMLMMSPGGSERTEVEYRSLFEKAGFKLTKIVPTIADISVIEGIRLS